MSTTTVQCRNISAKDLSFESVNDECQMDWINGLDAFLYNVIAILILDTFQYIAIQLLRYLHLPNSQSRSPYKPTMVARWCRG